jgi:hypothetical protein
VHNPRLLQRKAPLPLHPGDDQPRRLLGRAALEEAGVELIAEKGEGAGVRLRKGGAPRANPAITRICARSGRRMRIGLARRGSKMTMAQRLRT